MEAEKRKALSMYLRDIRDPRRRQGRTYPLASILNVIGVTQLAGGHSGDEPSNGGWPPGGWLPWPHTNSPLSATDTPPAAKRLARPEANDPES